MDLKFWHEKWQKKEIGFHQEKINPHLIQFWKMLNISKGKRILAPLCGKSRDMLWLLSQGYPVVGVEVSSLAVEAFFHENNLRPTHIKRGKLIQWRCGELEILLGDFFDLQAADIGEVAGVYDRASLIALSGYLRERYVQRLADLLPQGSPTLLITVEYPEEEMKGPPFSVNGEEIKRLYEPHFKIKKLLEQDALADSPCFQERGLTRFMEMVTLLIRN